MPSAQAPPFSHGAVAHSSMLISQFVPAKPVGHVHEYEATPSLQVPPFSHGAVAQSSTLISQLAPAKPVGQVHA